MNKKSFYLTDKVLKQDEVMKATLNTVTSLGIDSREFPDFCLEQMEKHKALGGTFEAFIPHWHQITDSDGRSIRNIQAGRNCQNLDLLRYLSLTLQISDEEYAAFVHQWCHDQIMCADEDNGNAWDF